MQPKKLQKNETTKKYKLFDLVSKQLSSTLLNLVSLNVNSAQNVNLFKSKNGNSLNAHANFVKMT